MDSAVTGQKGGFALLAGVLLAAYGGLVLLRILPHESPLVGFALVVVGVAIIATAHRAAPAAAAAVEAAPVRAAGAAVMGVLAAGGVLVYNAYVHSGLELPEVGILVYGLLLLVASRYVHRADVSAAVAWSFPLVAAPLGLYALDAVLDTFSGASPLDAFIEHGLVTPLAWSLGALGFEADVTGQTVQLVTPRGLLALGVGVVCAGFHPGVVFLGVLAFHAWQARTPPPRLAILMALGLAGVYVANLLRLLVLALVGYQWGGPALATTHAHAGWLLFLGWMIAYWWIVLRRFEGRVPPRTRGQ